MTNNQITNISNQIVNTNNLNKLDLSDVQIFTTISNIPRIQSGYDAFKIKVTQICNTLLIFDIKIIVKIALYIWGKFCTHAECEIHIKIAFRLKEIVKEAKQAAKEYDEAIRQGHVLEELPDIYQYSSDDMPTSVFLLTDGEVYNVDQIVELIKSSEEKKRDDLRVFSIGIGDTVSHHLVELVSRPPIKGYNITWTNQILEDTLLIEINPVDKPTIGFFSDNATPPPDTQTIFKDMKIQQAPFLIPSIYPGARFIIYCILEKGVEPCKEIILKNLFKTLKKEIHLFIRHPRNTRNKGKNISDSFISEQIVKLDVTYSLTSKYTSFLTVDERGSELVAEAKTFNLQRIVPVTGATFALSAPVTKLKPPKIETLYSFLNLQSFDGSFLPSDKFYSWFGKNNFKDFESIGIDDEKVLCLALALAYLEIIMFETFKEECEMCYVKAKKILKKEVGGDEQKVNENLEKAKEWVKK
ncbi:4574_t:CDS:2 [Gigaspora rosea]|nr:4574_t:CDS:2 [Gigaspora rosea]